MRDDQWSRVLAIDWGARMLGVAVTGRASQSSTGLIAVAAKRASWEPAFAKLMRDWQPDGLAIGWPLMMGGETSPSCERVLSFAHMIGRAIDAQVALVDERLTSREAAESTHDEAVHIESARLIGERWLAGETVRVLDPRRVKTSP